MSTKDQPENLSPLPRDAPLVASRRVRRVPPPRTCLNVRSTHTMDVRAFVTARASFPRDENERSGHPSPGELFASRAVVTRARAGEDAYDVIIASGDVALSIEVDLGDGVVERGKENALRPREAEAERGTRELGASSSGREIQSLSLSGDETKLFIVDNYGVVDVFERDVEGDAGFVSTRARGVGASDVEGVGGWCGVVSSAERDKMFVAKSSSRVIDVYDGDRRVRRMNTLLRPYDAKLTSPIGGGQSVIVVAEGHHFAVYDDRQDERGGCVSRIPVGYNKPLYTVSTSRAPGLENIVACAGEERVVHILDVRKWGCMERWRNAAKFDITQLELSSSAPGYAYVAGLDYECVCGNWREQKSEGGFSFRADTRWMGIASRPTACGRGDVLAGWAESGLVYALRAQPKSEE